MSEIAVYFGFGLILGALIVGVLWFFWTDDDQHFGDGK